MKLKHRLLAAGTVTALAIAPATAAFAQDPEPAAEEPSPLDALAETLADWASALAAGRDATSGDDVDEGTQTAFDELVVALEGALTEMFATLFFDTVEAAAISEAIEAGDGEGANGEAVSTLAQCAPRGTFKALVDGMANHGEYITAAAHGETVSLAVPTVDTGEDGTITVTPAEDGATTDFDLTTVEGADALCDALDVVYQARLLQLEVAWEDVDTSRDARVLAREQCMIERLRAKNGASEADPNEVCAELRQRVRDQHAADKDEARAAREEAKSARADARAERQAEHGQPETD